MQSHFLAAVNQLCAEKNLPKESVMEIVKAALKAAFKKDFGHLDEEIEVEISENIDAYVIYVLKEVTDDVEDEEYEISVKDAKKYKKDAKVGDTVRIDVTPTSFGRIAAQAAKQVIIQQLQEVERELMYEMFKDRENELINALVHRVQDDIVYIDLGKITVILPKEHRIPGERYYAGQRVKLYLDKVIKTSKGPQLLISRTHPDLVRKLMELEIPEIQSGVVEIKNIARDAGVRTKLTVKSNDDKIDPIGACVGQKGARIQNVMDELFGERIDIIYHSDKPEELLRKALSPAEIVYVDLDLEARHARVYVEEDQRPLAIGSRGQNVRLASKLTELIIDILNASELTEEQLEKARTSKAQEMNQEIKKGKKAQELAAQIHELAIDEKYLNALEAAGLTLIDQLKGLSAKDLATIDGIDIEGGEMIQNAIKDRA
jgi:N utilization substance protein A